MYTKLIYALFFVAVVAAAVPPHSVSQDCQPGKDHTLKLGARVDGDRVVFEGIITINSSTNGVVEKDISWKSDAGEKITYIELINQDRDGLGGCASVTSGGVGQSNAKLHFVTPATGTASFQISVYGK